MSREVLFLKAQLKERDEEIAALKHKLAQLEKVECSGLNVILNADGPTLIDSSFLASQ